MDEQIEYLIACVELQLAAYGIEFTDVHDAMEDMFVNLEESWWEHEAEREFCLPDFIEVIADDDGPGHFMRLHWEGYSLTARVIPESVIDAIAEMICRTIPA